VLDVADSYDINVPRLGLQLLNIHDRVVAETRKRHKNHAELLESYISSVDGLVDAVKINGQWMSIYNIISYQFLFQK